MVFYCAFNIFYDFSYCYPKNISCCFSSSIYYSFLLSPDSSLYFEIINSCSLSFSSNYENLSCTYLSKCSATYKIKLAIKSLNWVCWSEIIINNVCFSIFISLIKILSRIIFSWIFVELLEVLFSSIINDLLTNILVFKLIPIHWLFLWEMMRLLNDLGFHRIFYIFM